VVSNVFDHDGHVGGVRIAIRGVPEKLPGLHMLALTHPPTCRAWSKTSESTFK
jgi:hypothetical protein